MTDEQVRQARRSFSFWPELAQGFDNLRAHKLRSILTMLGMIFGVAAVIAMLSIGAGAQQQMIAFIQQLGVRKIRSALTRCSATGTRCSSTTGCTAPSARGHARCAQRC